MDITFTCKSCGQRIEIDKTGAGLCVQCPTCNVSLTVPPPTTLSPLPNTAPSSEELRSRCRDLVYELRLEEAICAIKEAEKARAFEKGYQLSEAFSFLGTAESMLECNKWAIAQSLQNLTLNEEREVLGALIWLELSGNSYREGSDEMRAVVIGSRLRFPYFDRWLRRFRASLGRSEMIETQENEEEESESDEFEFYENELAKPTDPLLARMHELSLPARRLLFGRRIEITQDELRDGGIKLEAAISELVTAGFARSFPSSSHEKRLERLSLAWLKSIQQKYGVKIPRAKKGDAPADCEGRRRRIVQHLITAIGVDQIAQELPAPPVYEVTRPESPRYFFEEYRAGFLTSFLSTVSHHRRSLLQSADAGFSRVRVFSGDSPEVCAVCLEANGKEFTIGKPPDLPHPDCFCPDGCKCMCIVVSENEPGPGQPPDGLTKYEREGLFP